MLHEHHRTSAPSATSVSISTAVWTVMCREPVIRAPFSGCASANSWRVAISPGISCSARRISLRPNSCRPRSATLKPVVVLTVVLIRPPDRSRSGGQQPLVLFLLESEPTLGAHLLRPARLGLEPRLHRL